MWEKEEEEEEALARSWVSTGEILITGTGQKEGKFLGWVFEIYEGLIPDGNKEQTSTA